MITRKLRSLFFRQRAEREMDAELADHLQSEIEAGLARGLSHEEARRQAEALLPRRSVIEEEIRDARGARWFEDFRQDLRFGLRLLLRQRGYTLTALATMALAIGSTTAVFSLIDATLLRPLPFTDPGRLYDATNVGMRGPLDVLRRESRFAQYAGHTGVTSFNMEGRPWPERAKGAQVSAEFFDTLGVAPLVGRVFQKSDRYVVILSHAFWRDRYNSRASAIGQQLLLNERSHEIIGVMPASFAFPEGGARFWVPLKMDPREVGEYWGTGGVSGLARLRPGATREQAQTELRNLIKRIHGMFPWRMPDSWGADARLLPLAESMTENSRTRHWLLFGVAMLLLAAALVNLASLTASLASARQAELNMRLSLGATAGRLTRQLLTESFLLAAAGGALGLLLAPAQLEILKALLPADTPRLAEAAIDGRVLAFAALLIVTAAFLFGLRRPTKRTRPRKFAPLVIAEAAVACILLCGSGLLLRTWWSLSHQEAGFQASSLITAELSPSRATLPAPKVTQLEREIHAELTNYPGVTHAGTINLLPLTPEISAATIYLEDHPRPASQGQFAFWVSTITPELPATLGFRLLRGRHFTHADHANAAPVALISRSTANRFWPNQDPIGRRWRPVWMKEWRTIIGVIDDVQTYSVHGMPEWISGTVFLPLAQTFTTSNTLALVARVEGDPTAFEKALPALTAKVCRECALSKIARIETVVSEAARAPRATATLTSAFAVLALAMAAVGLFGVTSHAVVRRTREFGIRLALGAQRSSIAWLVLGGALRDTLLGAAIGLLAALALARLMKTLLYGVSQWDPWTFAAAPAVLALAALAACAVPLWRASTADATRALREN